MRDAFQPIIWSDLTTVVAPGLISLALGISALIQPMGPLALAVLLGVHLAVMAAAARSSASRAALRLRVWRSRQAPSNAQPHVAGEWRRRAAWLLALGGIGPLAMVWRLAFDREPGWAIWTAVAPVLGWALGSFSAWAWHGFADRAWLGVGVTLVLVVPVLFSFWGPLWMPGTELALTVAAVAVVLARLVWERSEQLQPQWEGFRPRAQSSEWTIGTKLRRSRWARLAFDSAEQNEAGNYWPLLSAQFNGMVCFVILGPKLLPYAYGHILDRWAPWVLMLCVLWLGVAFASGLVFREQHWRLRLAPGGRSPVWSAWTMLAGSTAFNLMPAAALVAMLWAKPQLGPASMVPACVAMGADLLFCFGYVAWMRGLNNRGPGVFFAVFGLALAVGVTGSIVLALGVPLRRGPAWVGIELLLAASFYVLAARQWSRRALRSMPSKPKGAAA